VDPEDVIDDKCNVLVNASGVLKYVTCDHDGARRLI